MFAGKSELVVKVKNSEDISNAIYNKLVKTKSDHWNQSIDKFLEQRVGPPDGNSALRASNYIERLF